VILGLFVDAVWVGGGAAAWQPPPQPKSKFKKNVYSVDMMISKVFFSDLLFSRNQPLQSADE